MRVRPLLLAFTIVLLDCATLEPLPSGTCGNGVVDANEDCDTFPGTQCGQPSEGAAQCRLKCGKNGAAPTCPDGWGCSSTGICRQPTGTFATASEPVSAGVTSMLVGDFDGDGRQDVLGSSASTSKGRIHYFNDDAAPDVIALPGVLASPSVYDFDGDGVSDIAFGYTFRGASEISEGTLELDASSGFAIILGQRDRQVVTKLFPTLTKTAFDSYLLQVSSAKAANLPDGVTVSGPNMALATVTPKSGPNVVVLASILPGYLQELPGALGDLAGDPLTANLFDKRPRSTCGEVVVPLSIDGSTDIRIYSPCLRDPVVPGSTVQPPVKWTTAGPSKEITIPGEALKGTFIADLDNDGHLDLVIATLPADGSTKVYVAWGVDGLDLDLKPAPTDLTDLPLAAGLIDSDCTIDLVVPGGVLLTSRANVVVKTPGGTATDDGDAGDAGTDAGLDLACKLPTSRAALTYNVVPVPTKKWTVAQVADVNRDGSLDVIGASKYEPDIDVLEGTKTLNMPSFSIPTTGSVRQLVVGDFDFNRTDDIAFVEAPGSSDEREVAIAYGRAFTMPPESPRPAGRLDGIRQLFVSASGVAITSISSPVAGQLASTSLAVLLASGDRQPVAPLLYGLGSSNPNNPPPAADVRRELTTQVLVTSAKPKGLADLVSLVGQRDFDRVTGKPKGVPSYAVWGAFGNAPISFDSPRQVEQLTGFPAIDSASGTFLIQMVSADLDGDGVAEVIAVSPNAAGTGADLRIINTVLNPTTLPAPISLPNRVTIGNALGNVHPELVDVDGDGSSDLVLILKDAATGTPQVNVLFGDGKGHLAVPGVTVAFPVPMTESASDYASTGFTQIITGGGAVGATGGRRRELAIVTTKHLFRVFVRPDHGLETADATAVFGTISTGSSVVAVDANGDGVQDLAIADGGSIRIAHQIARLP